MRLVKFPEYYQSENLGDTPICFLAGCCVYNKWREEIIEELKLYNIIVVDPYNTNITSIYEQIRWEHYYLNNFINKNFIFSVYFDKYSTQPISMYELGKATALCKRTYVKVETDAQQIAVVQNYGFDMVISLHEECPLKQDIICQCGLEHVDVKVRTIQEHTNEIIRCYKDIKHRSI